MPRQLLPLPLLAALLSGCPAEDIAPPVAAPDCPEAEDSLQSSWSPDAPAGMTWSLYWHDSALDVDLIGCYGDAEYGACNAYQGDLPCSRSAPVLCIRYTDAPNPGVDDDFYHGWAAGDVAITEPISGLELVSLQAADALCEATHGEGWQMAEFHDGGGGWSWHAHGDIGTTERLWVYIDDQPANCWDQL